MQKASMTPSRIAELRTLAETGCQGVKSAALNECLDEIVRLKKQVTHLSLRCKPPKQKPLGLGSKYGVG